MNVWTTISGLFTPAVSREEAFGKAVAADVVAWLRATKAALVGDFRVAWLVMRPILTGVAPAQWVILQDLVRTAEADVVDGDYGNLVTDVLNQAAARELAWVAQMSSALLTVIVAALHLQAPAKAKTA